MYVHILTYICAHIHVYTHTVKLKSSLQFQHLFKYPEITKSNFQVTHESLSFVLWFGLTRAIFRSCLFLPTCFSDH